MNSYNLNGFSQTNPVRGRANSNNQTCCVGCRGWGLLLGLGTARGWDSNISDSTTDFITSHRICKNSYNFNGFSQTNPVRGRAQIQTNKQLWRLLWGLQGLGTAARAMDCWGPGLPRIGFDNGFHHKS